MRRLVPALAAVLATLAVGLASAQTGEGPAWSSLSASQRNALAPLQAEWGELDAAGKQKWMDIATRFPHMSPNERERVRERMAAWARMSPRERGQARLQFQQARQMSAEERRARWEAYQALPPEEREGLARRAAPPRRAARQGDDVPAAKSNLVPNPAHTTPPPRPVSPSVVRAAPGATTTLVTRPPAQPAHQQTGLPKIAVTPGFVDANTLLPKRGPQAAAARSPAKPDRDD